MEKAPIDEVPQCYSPHVRATVTQQNRRTVPNQDSDILHADTLPHMPVSTASDLNIQDFWDAGDIQEEEEASTGLNREAPPSTFGPQIIQWSQAFAPELLT